MQDEPIGGKGCPLRMSDVW